MLELIEKSVGIYEIIISDNRKAIGECTMDVDGYYYFWSYSDGGWNEYTLREVARLLGGLNLEWDRHLQENLK